VAGGTGWINGWETFDARALNSESDGQHPDPDVQRQLWADIDVKLRAIVKRGERRNMTTSLSGEAEGIYRMNPTICRELRSSAGEINICWSDDHSTVRLDRLLRNTYVCFVDIIEVRGSMTLDAGPGFPERDTCQLSGRPRSGNQRGIPGTGRKSSKTPRAENRTGPPRS